MLPDPGEADIFSPSEYTGVVFYSGHSINLPDWDFGAQSLQLTLTAPTTLLSMLNIISHPVMSKSRYEWFARPCSAGFPPAL